MKDETSVEARVVESLQTHGGPGRLRAWHAWPVAVAVVVASCATLTALLLPGYSRVDERLAREHASRVTEALAVRARELRQQAGDWARWDDLYEFLAGSKNGFPAREISAGILSNLSLSAVILVPDHGRAPLAFQLAPDGRLTNQWAGLTSLHDRLRSDYGRPQVPFTGWIETDGRRALISLHPVVRSDGSGDASGWVAFLRPFDAPEIEELARELRVSLETRPVAEISARARVVGDRMESVVPLPGSDGEPIRGVRVSSPRDMHAKGVDSLLRANGAMAAIGLLGGLIAYLLLRREVDSRAALGLAEQRFQQLVEQADDGIALVSVERAEIVLANESFLRMFSAPGGSDDTQAADASFIHELIGGFGSTSESTATTRAGHTVSLRRQRMGSATAPSVLVIARDVSTLVAQQRDLERALSREESLNDELRVFAYAASHDLQEPLRKVRMFADRIGAAASDSQGIGGWLARLDATVDHMQRLIDATLAYSRVAESEPVHVAVELEPLVRAAWQDLEAVAETCDARLALEVLPTVTGDPMQLRRVFQNLLGNALKFRVADRGVRISVRGGIMVDSSGVRVARIVVEDNGLGFEQKFAERIFHPFKRLHSRDDYPGSGLGLAMVARIVRAHGGTISAEGRPGEGARFCIDLRATI